MTHLWSISHLKNLVHAAQNSRYSSILSFLFFLPTKSTKASFCFCCCCCEVHSSLLKKQKLETLGWLKAIWYCQLQFVAVCTVSIMLKLRQCQDITEWEVKAGRLRGVNVGVYSHKATLNQQESLFCGVGLCCSKNACEEWKELHHHLSRKQNKKKSILHIVSVLLFSNCLNKGIFMNLKKTF